MRSEASTSSAASIAVTAALVAVGCALGASAGLLARFPGLGAAILFLPYAIVTAALLRSAPRHWWIILLAAAAGNFLPSLAQRRELAFVLLAEVVNDARAIIAALGIRRCARARAGSSPCARWSPTWSSPCWWRPRWRRWVARAWCRGSERRPDSGWSGSSGWLSNAITGLIVLPLLTVDVRALLSGGVRLPARRVAEAALLAASLLVVGAAVFARSYDRSPTHQAHLYWALPFLLWAAVRFGPRGTCAALMGVTSLSVWGAIAGRGPFAPDASTENLLELQVFLLAVSIPVLLLASLIEQQRRTAAALTDIEKRKSVEAALRESNRRKDEFLGDARTRAAQPAGADQHRLQILREAPPASRDAAWARESIGRQLSHMTRLLDDLLDISRVTLGKIQLQLAPVSVGQVDRERGGGDAPADRLGRAPLTVKLPEDALVICGDAVRLTQVVANLINNAAKYTERGGRIDVAVDRDDGAEVRSRCATTASASPPTRWSGSSICSPSCPAETSARGRPRHRAHAGAPAGGDARRDRRGAQRGPEPWHRDRRAPAATAFEAAPRPPPAAPVAGKAGATSLRILAVDDNVHMAQGLASILRMWGHTSAPRMTAPPPWRSRRSSRPRSCCWI